MHVVIYEGSHWHTFAPLSLNRPVFMLSTGMATLFDKQIRYLGASRITLWVRPELVEYCKVRVIPQLKIPAQVNVPLDDEPALLVSGRTLLFRPFKPPQPPHPRQPRPEQRQRELVGKALIQTSIFTILRMMR